MAMEVVVLITEEDPIGKDWRSDSDWWSRVKWCFEKTETVITVKWVTLERMYWRDEDQ